MSHNRPDRVAELVHAEIARVIREESSDPRLEGVSVTHVEMTPDLEIARVGVLPLGGEGDRSELEAALESACGFIRRQVGRRLRLRYTPALEFRIDEAYEEGVRMTTLLGRMERERMAREE